jgi:hypothetical protein
MAGCARALVSIGTMGAHASIMQAERLSRRPSGRRLVRARLPAPAGRWRHLCLALVWLLLAWHVLLGGSAGDTRPLGPSASAQPTVLGALASHGLAGDQDRADFMAERPAAKRPVSTTPKDTAPGPQWTEPSWAVGFASPMRHATAPTAGIDLHARSARGPPAHREMTRAA